MKKILLISVVLCTIVLCVVLSCKKHFESDEIKISGNFSGVKEEEDSIAYFLKEDTTYSFTSLVFDEKEKNKIVTIKLSRILDTVFVKRTSDTSSFVNGYAYILIDNPDTIRSNDTVLLRLPKSRAYYKIPFEEDHEMGLALPLLGYSCACASRSGGNDHSCALKWEGSSFHCNNMGTECDACFLETCILNLAYHGGFKDLNEHHIIVKTKYLKYNGQFIR